MSALKHSLPIAIPSFINKLGTIGLNLIPMLLVQQQFSSLDSSFVMTMTKIFVFVGTFLGGFLCDRYGTKVTLLLSFFFGGLGMMLLPYIGMVWVGVGGIALMAAISQMGTSMFPVPVRLLIVDHLPKNEHQESIGWMRMANNLGQIVSYSITFFGHALGLKFFLLFDACTSFAAMLVGFKKIPGKKIKAQTIPGPDNYQAKLKKLHHDWFLFYMVAIISAGFAFIYESYMASTAARCQLLFGDAGLKTFSEIMLINTIICTLCAVAASRHIKNPKFSFPLGILLCGLGLFVTTITTSKSNFYYAAFLVTLGEIVFSALAAYILIIVTPEVKHKGRIYSYAIMIQNSGKVLGSSLVFPLFVYNPGAQLWAILSVAAVFFAFVLIASRLSRHLAWHRSLETHE